jgi:hypothetical protein
MIETISHICEEDVIFASDGPTTISITFSKKYRVRQYAVSVMENE